MSLRDLPVTGPGGQFTSSSGPPYPIGTVATLTCSAGYLLPRRFTSVVSDGKTVSWDPPEILCNPVQCMQPPLIEHGSFDSSSRFRFPESVEYACEPGYRLNHFLNRFYCGARGEWTPEIPGHLRCDPVQCPPPKQPANGRMLSLTKGFFYDSVVQFQCDPHFVPARGDATRRCQSDGTWSGEDILCEPIRCPPVHPKARVLPGFADNPTLKAIDCGNNLTVWIKCLPTERWSKDYPYCPGGPQPNPPIPPPLNPPVPPPPLNPPVPPPLNPPVPPLNPPVPPPNLPVKPSIPPPTLHVLPVAPTLKQKYPFFSYICLLFIVFLAVGFLSLTRRSS